jgi:hypothetical protein
VAVARVRNDTLSGDPYTTLLDSTVGEGVAEVTTQRSTTERWPIASGMGLGPINLSVTDGSRALRFGGTASRADTATQTRPSHLPCYVTRRGFP